MPRRIRSCDAFLAHQPMDLVAIGSPSGLHAEQGIRAAGRGLHVLVEKPIDVTVSRGGRADRGVRRRQRASSACSSRIARSPISSGSTSRCTVAGSAARCSSSARVKWYRPPEYYSQSRWRGTWALDGGGALMNQGIHTVDLLQWMFGPVSRVTARTRTSLHAIEVEDTAVAMLEFASGAIGTFEATTAAYPGYTRRVEFTGTGGHDGPRARSADRRRPAQPADDLIAGDAIDQNLSASSPVVSDVRGHQRMIEDFFDAIQAGREPTCSGREGRRSVAARRGDLRRRSEPASGPISHGTDAVRPFAARLHPCPAGAADRAARDSAAGLATTSGRCGASAG